MGQEMKIPAERGLGGIGLVVSDGLKSIKNAIAEIFPSEKH